MNRTGDCFRTLELDQVPETHDFDLGLGQIHIRLRLVVERMGLGVVKPFTGSVQFLEDVLHHAEVFVHSHLAVVLPTALVGDFTVRRSCP